MFDSSTSISTATYCYNEVEDCSSCAKADVCKFKDTFMNYKKNFSGDAPSFIVVKIGCNHFLSRLSNTRFFGYNGTNGTDDLLTNECKITSK